MKQFSLPPTKYIAAVALTCASPALAQSTSIPPVISATFATPALTTATLEAAVTSGPARTSVWFQWGFDDSYGNVTPVFSLANASTQTIQATIVGLTPYTTYHFQAYASNSYGIVMSGDAVFTTVPQFVQVGTVSNWTAAVLSGDGKEIVATMSNVIYIATNLAGPFVPTAGTGTVAATSYDGSVIVALSVSGTQVITSNDRGATWATNATPAPGLGAYAQFVALAATTNGYSMIAADGDREFYTTTSLSSGWNGVGVPYPPVSHVATSDDGSYMYGGCEYYGTVYIYGLENRGRQWSIYYPIGGASTFAGISCSADGSEVVVATGDLLYSQDYCSSFNETDTPLTNVQAVAVSLDKSTIICSVGNGIDVAPNEGTEFYSATVPFVSTNNPFTGVMSSGDGTTLAAFNGSIFVSMPTVLLTSPTIADGVISFQVNGNAYTLYQVQASPDLVNWSNIDVVGTGGDGTTQAYEAVSDGSNYQFYRVVRFSQ